MQLPLPVVLASASPRRQQLLRTLIPDFEVVVSEVDEDALTVPDPRRTAERLAEAKAQAVAALRPDALIIGGDTVVALGQLQLAKPSDEQDAERMLSLLSGQTHEVITGLSLVWPGGRQTFSDSARVTFRSLDYREISAYVHSGEPMDKAGAYAIQGGASTFVAKLEGHISTVIGFPLEILEVELGALVRRHAFVASQS
jgi:septum formation protein